MLKKPEIEGLLFPQGLLQTHPVCRLPISACIQEMSQSSICLHTLQIGAYLHNAADKVFIYLFIQCAYCHTWVLGMWKVTHGLVYPYNGSISRQRIKLSLLNQLG